jgi:hypothetical protein
LARLTYRLLPLALLAQATLASAAQQEFDLSLDLRAVAVSSNQLSFQRGGGGALRYDRQHDGLQLGSLRLGYRSDPLETLRLTAEAVAYGDHDQRIIDLTELALSWRPVPTSLLRHELKIGAFYPAISLEHRMRGWRTPYTLSASALNTWIGEELRTIGAEYNVDWLGQQQQSDWNLGCNAAVFGFNDPAGVVMADRGWALHDRQTTLFGRLGQRGQGLVPGRKLFYRDIDHRAGWYGGASANYRGLLELRALHYDNRGDPTVQAPEIDDGAWHTRFNSAGLRWTPDEHWTLMGQWLQGDTAFNEDAAPITGIWDYSASYWLLSWAQGKHRLSARRDDFRLSQPVSATPDDHNHETGAAWTVAWLYTVNEHLTLAAEWLRVNSNLAYREEIGAPAAALETQLQLALRVEL